MITQVNDQTRREAAALAYHFRDAMGERGDRIAQFSLDDSDQWENAAVKMLEIAQSANTMSTVFAQTAQFIQDH